MWSKIKFVFSSLWTLVEPLMKIFAQQAGTVALNSAIKAVKVVSTTMGTADGEAKRKAAFEAILDDLKIQGYSIGTSVINASIETALAYLKSKP